MRIVGIVAGLAAVFGAMLLYVHAHFAPPVAVALTIGMLLGLIGAITASTFWFRRRGTASSTAEDAAVELQRFADSVPYMLWRMTPDGKLDYVNNRYTECTGDTPEQALTLQNWRSFWHPDDAARGQTIGAQARLEADAIRYHFRLRRPDGSYRWMLLEGKGIRSEAGVVEKWYGGVTDVDAEIRASEKIAELNATLEKRVEERTRELLRTEARYSRLFEASALGFAEFLVSRSSSDGKSDGEENGGPADGVDLIHANSAFRSILDFSPETALTTGLLLQSGFPSEIIQHLTVLAATQGKYVDGHAVLTTNAGREIAIFYTFNEISSSSYLLSVRDETERRNIDTMKAQAQDHLARINRIEAVGAFSSALAHELAQPITAMEIDAGIVLRELERADGTFDLARRAVSRIIRSSDRASGIIQSTRARIAGGNRTASDVDLAGLIRTTVELLDRELNRSHVRTSIDLPADLGPIHGDAVRLQQVMVNLINNAIEALGANPSTDRSIRIMARNGTDHVIVSVEDNGPGIAKENLETLFDPFFTTKSGGVGIGLEICKDAVLRHGGTLVARNADSGGAVFEFTLPFERVVVLPR